MGSGEKTRRNGESYWEAVTRAEDVDGGDGGDGGARTMRWRIGQRSGRRMYVDLVFVQMLIEGEMGATE